MIKHRKCNCFSFFKYTGYLKKVNFTRRFMNMRH